MSSVIVVVLCCVGAIVFAASVVAVWLWVTRCGKTVSNTSNALLSKTCPSITFGNTAMTCMDILQKFGPALTTYADTDEPMTCRKYQKIFQMDEVKSALQQKSIPSNFCSMDCCNLSMLTYPYAACVGSTTPDDNALCDNDMCVHGITEEEGWDCQAGRPFTIETNGRVRDSLTSGIYNASMYGDVKLKDAKTVCCTTKK